MSGPGPCVSLLHLLIFPRKSVLDIGTNGQGIIAIDTVIRSSVVLDRLMWMGCVNAETTGTFAIHRGPVRNHVVRVNSFCMTLTSLTLSFPDHLREFSVVMIYVHVPPQNRF